MKAAFKLWIDQDGKTFGDGPYELLTNVEKMGSLHKACAQMGMSYSKAWKLIRNIEQRLGFFVLDREVGGRFGGGSKITPRTKELMTCYARFRDEAKKAVERIYREQFLSFEKPGASRTSRRL
ncbi:MAG: LysR family transcriptional regulator [Thermodesulfobacteriota bacterium]|jgi:molybdate transport system regulatory protein